MFHAHKTEFAEKGWMGMFKVIDNSQDDKNDADLMSNSTEKPNNASNPSNQSYLVVDSSQTGVKNADLENNNMVYNYTSYELDKNSLHNNQQHTNNPIDVISSYQYGANSSQAKPSQAKPSQGATR